MRPPAGNAAAARPRGLHGLQRPGSHRAARAATAALVVDDERQICEVLTKFLTSRGYRVQSAQDGPAALALAASERPQFIVLDINMPGMNGIEVLRKLRASRTNHC